MFSCRGLALAISALSLLACSKPRPPEPQTGGESRDYRNAALAPEERAQALLSQMTLPEKLGQLRATITDPEGSDRLAQQLYGNLGILLSRHEPAAAAEKYNRLQRFMVEKTRLGIPFIMHDEAVTGLKHNGATTFPQPLAQAATFDLALMQDLTRAIAAETHSRGIRQVLSPTVNVVHDPRWGRVHETYGEDPYLTAMMGAAFVRSFEGAGIVTTLKHFVANHGSNGRNSGAVFSSERYLRTYMLPPFELGVRAAKARSIMPAYNTIDGVPCSSNNWLLDDVLRGEWGFDGFVVSDYGAIGRLVRPHATAASKAEAARDVLVAGLDVEFPEVDYYGAPLEEALTQGLVQAKHIDRAVARVLKAKFQLGLFDKPYADPEAAARINGSAEHRTLARKVAEASIVLLKNDKATLPVAADVKRIAVLGPLGDEVLLGNYAGWGLPTVSLYQGLKAQVPLGVEVVFNKGVELEGVAYPPLPSQFMRPTATAGGNAARGLKGEYFPNKDFAGQPAVVRVDPVIDFDWGTGIPDPAMPADEFSVRWTGFIEFPETRVYELGITRNDGVRLWIDDQLLVDKWSTTPAVLETLSFKAEKGRPYKIRLDYYEDGNKAIVRLGAKMDLEKRFKEAVAAAARAQVAIVVVGSQDGEGKDRSHLELAEAQERLIEAVAATGTPTVVVLQSGNVIAMGRWIDKVQAVVEAWYPGIEGGNAIASVLLGSVNPGGRLPITFARHTGQLPLYYNAAPAADAGPYSYIDGPGDPLFPFGHGLSYTSFAYGPIKLAAEKIGAAETANVQVEIKNTGTVAGDEVVQLYVADLVGSVARPEQSLQGFARVTLAPGEAKTVEFTLGPDQLRLFGRNNRFEVEPGAFEVRVGASSADIRARAKFEVIAR